MSKVGEYQRELDELGPAEGLREDPPVTNCCTAEFNYPGYPDSDTCSRCGEHADAE